MVLKVNIAACRLQFGRMLEPETQGDDLEASGRSFFSCWSPGMDFWTGFSLHSSIPLHCWTTVLPMRSVVSKCHLESLDFPMCIESMSKDIRSLDSPGTAWCAPRNHKVVEQCKDLEECRLKPVQNSKPGDQQMKNHLPDASKSSPWVSGSNLLKSF